MSELGRKHECRALMEPCGQPIHLYAGSGRNTLYVWHFETPAELREFLTHNRWTPDRITRLEDAGEFEEGDEWARLERA